MKCSHCGKETDNSYTQKVYLDGKEYNAVFCNAHCFNMWVIDMEG